jgi:hypothetical protein
MQLTVLPTFVLEDCFGGDEVVMLSGSKQKNIYVRKP